MLKRRTKFGYGAAEMGMVAVELLVELYLLKFYNTLVGLPSIFTGLALGIAIFWDAISDPLMGEISDQTRHRRGRRRPFLVPGGIALAITFIVIFNPPDLGSTFARFLYLLLSYLALTSSMTVIGVPHLALGGEMSFDRDERTEIFGIRRLYSTMGLLVGVSLPAAALHLFAAGEVEGNERSWTAVSLAVGALVLLTAAITHRSTRGLDPARARPARNLGLGHLLRAQLGVARSPVFRWLLIGFLVAGLGRAINASLALYYYEYRLGFTETETILWILLPFFLGILASIPAWVAISKRFGKRRPAMLGVLGLGLVVSLAYPFMPDRAIGIVLPVVVVSGFLGGAIILLESLVADVVDVDELETGANREGLYFGMWRMGTKLSRAGGMFLSGVMLQWIGFDETAQQQSASTLAGLAWIFGPGVGGLLILGGLAMIPFPLSDAKHRAIQERLRHQRAATATSPSEVP